MIYGNHIGNVELGKDDLEIIINSTNARTAKVLCDALTEIRRSQLPYGETHTDIEITTGITDDGRHSVILKGSSVVSLGGVFQMLGRIGVRYRDPKRMNAEVYANYTVEPTKSET